MANLRIFHTSIFNAIWSRLRQSGQENQGIERDDLARRLLDLKEIIEAFEENVHGLRSALKQLREANNALGETPNVEGLQVLEQLVCEMLASCIQFWKKLNAYEQTLYAWEWLEEELIEDYENINDHISLISRFTRTVQQIYVDLPGFIERIALDDEDQ